MLENTHGTYLIVDDDEGMRTLLKALLENKNHRVLTAASPQEALDVIQQNYGSISAVVIDLNLGGDRGELLFDAIYSVMENLPIFMMSGCGENEMLARIKHRKVAGMITKPFHSASFAETLQSETDRFLKENLSSQSV